MRYENQTVFRGTSHIFCEGICYSHFRLRSSRVNITFDLVARDQNLQVLKADFLSFQKFSHCNFERCSFTCLFQNHYKITQVWVV